MNRAVETSVKSRYAFENIFILEKNNNFRFLNISNISGFSIAGKKKS
jgi:hypothetical protein